jgi:predicted ArsR family transcriptional regulator
VDSNKLLSQAFTRDRLVGVTRVDEQAERYAVLEDPQRRRIYLIVRSQHRAMTRDEVAEKAGVSRNLAAFHLDRLLEAGLLHAHFARPPGVGGPGAGRPAKRYALTDAEVALMIPHRNYDLAGRLLAEAVDQAEPGEDVRKRLAALARAEGRTIGEAQRRSHKGRPLSGRGSVDAVVDLAEGLGYEPVPDDGGDAIVLANCPFHALVATAPSLVCGLNLNLLAGAVEGLGASGVEPVLDPADGRCCVVLHPVADSAKAV